MLVGTMAKKKPIRVEPACQEETRRPGPKEDLRLCILYLVTYGGSSLEELAEATGMDPDTVDRCMVGQKPVSRELVEQFCRAAGTSLPRVELALPTVRWIRNLLKNSKNSQEILPKAEIEHEGRIQAAALEVSFSVYDIRLREMTTGVAADSLERRSYEAMASTYSNAIAEAFRVGARFGLRMGKTASSPAAEEESGD
jgi:hypothetical protein